MALALPSLGSWSCPAGSTPIALIAARGCVSWRCPSHDFPVAAPGGWFQFPQYPSGVPGVQPGELGHGFGLFGSTAWFRAPGGAGVAP